MEEKQTKLKILLQENKITLPSYTLYGGLSGFQDYGNLGLKVKNNLIDCWKKYFLNELDDNIFEIETPIIMPYNILK
jgi:glycyl-tRNA synthetase